MIGRPHLYIAAAYTAGPLDGLRRATAAFDDAVTAGWVPVVPHTNMLLDLQRWRSPEFWYAYTLAIALRCDALYTPWDAPDQRSIGVANEIAAMLAAGKPVYAEHGKTLPGTTPPEGVQEVCSVPWANGIGCAVLEPYEQEAVAAGRAIALVGKTLYADEDDIPEGAVPPGCAVVWLRRDGGRYAAY